MNRRHRADAAIAHALARRWDLAAQENRALLEDDPNDVEAANRLGKALTELGDTAGAIEAYEQALKIDATNAIARKNLARLDEQRKAKRPARTPARAKTAAPGTPAPRSRRVDVATESLRTAPLIEDFGKSADLRLSRVNARAASQVSTGDPAELELTSSGVAVKANGGAILGHIDPRTGLRLKRMIEGGNKYSVVILRSEEGQVEVHVREVSKHPSLVGQASFLPQLGDKRRSPRAYTKASVLQYDRVDDDDDFDSDDEEDVWRPRNTATFDSPVDAEEDEEDDEEEFENAEDEEEEDDDEEEAPFTAEDDDAPIEDADDELEDDEDEDDDD
jgi:tetratricopeptide (TPR) repeat protein